MVDEKDLPELAAVFKTAIAAHMAPLQAEIAVLKARLDDRPAPKGRRPGTGRQGRSSARIDYDFLLKESLFKVKEAAAAIPAPIGKDGAPGRDAPAGSPRLIWRDRRRAVRISRPARHRRQRRRPRHRRQGWRQRSGWQGRRSRP